MKLTELPSMLVERVEVDGDQLRIVGRFDRLDGVREGGCFRLSRREYAWADLNIVSRRPFWSSPLIGPSGLTGFTHCSQYPGWRMLWLSQTIALDVKESAIATRPLS